MFRFGPARHARSGENAMYLQLIVILQWVLELGMGYAPTWTACTFSSPSAYWNWSEFSY